MTMKFVHKDHWMVVQHRAKWLRDQTNLATSAAREKRRRQRMYLSWIHEDHGQNKNNDTSNTWEMYRKFMTLTLTYVHFCRAHFGL